MPNILKTPGIVLRNRPFKESSLFCSIFTEKFGKLRLAAKGARRPRSKFCGSLEPFTHVEVIFYKRESKEVYTLSDAVIISDFSGLRNSQNKFIAGQVICEFIDQFTVREEPNRNLYDELLLSLGKIASGDDDIACFWSLLMLFRLLKYAGIEPNLTDCICCHKPVADNTIINFSIGRGGLVCEEDFDESVFKLDKAAFKLLIDSRKGIFPKSCNFKAFLTLRNLFEAYIFYHLNGLSLNSLKLLKY
ncbi:MAG: DNA repair protein RecO [candidate division WOR-3 bacterium]|nr:DNA repair protein RecO [candidate division WOR-3 bacterium]